MSFEILTRNEAAERARISRRFLDKQIALGRGPAVFHIGGKTLVRSDALEAWLESLTAQQMPDASA